MIAEGKFARFESDYIAKAGQVPMVVKSLQFVVREFADMIDSHIKQSMQLPKSGLPYVRPGGRTHIASAPGEAPAVDTGKLIGSIAIQYGGGGLEAEIGVFGDPYYAGFLEGGTARMAARPYIKPAADLYGPQFVAGIAAALKFGAGGAH